MSSSLGTQGGSRPLPWPGLSGALASIGASVARLELLRWMLVGSRVLSTVSCVEARRRARHAVGHSRTAVASLGALTSSPSLV